MADERTTQSRREEGGEEEESNTKDMWYDHGEMTIQA